MDTLHKILDLMWKNGISDAELCARARINKSAVTDWKKGKTKSYMKHLPEIARVLNTTIEYLEGETDQKEKPAEGELSEMQVDILKRLMVLSPEKQEQMSDYLDFLLSQQDGE